MTDIRSGELSVLLLESPFHKDETVQALSAAIKAGMACLFGKEDGSSVYAGIDALPEKALDLLAVELRSPYYSGDMDISVKRGIIKKSLEWNTRAGTPAAVRELIRTVFGSGDIVEWFDYEEPPYTPGTFDIHTSEVLSEDIIKQFLFIIDRVKNVRSHIRRIWIHQDIPCRPYIGCALQATSCLFLASPPEREGQEARRKIHPGATVSIVPDGLIARRAGMPGIEAAGHIYAGAGARGALVQRIISFLESGGVQCRASIYAGSAVGTMPEVFMSTQEDTGNG